MSQNFTTEDIDEESGKQTDEYAEFQITKNKSLGLHLPKLEDVQHPLVPESKDNKYQLREINGTTDLELLSYVINDPDYFAMLEGEAGVGKNMSIDVLCASANWPRVRVNFGIGTTYQNLVGRYAPAGDEDIVEEAVSRDEAVENTSNRIQIENGIGEKEARKRAEKALPEGGKFKWTDGLLTKAVKNGWMFVADEINAADNEAILPLNGVTENNEDRYLTIEEKSEIIRPHENFRFVATRNPITYAGVSEMNAALESRAYVVNFDYHESAAIEEIIRQNTDMVENESEKAVEQLVSLAQDIRRMEQEGTQLVTQVSTRDLLKVGRLTDIMSVRDATKTVLLGIADPADEQSIRELIETHKFL